MSTITKGAPIPQAVRIVRDPKCPPPAPRPQPRPRPVIDRWSPEEIERQASEAASGAPDGMDGWRKAGALLAAYRLLYREYLGSQARIRSLEDQQTDPVFWPARLPR